MESKNWIHRSTTRIKWL